MTAAAKFDAWCTPALPAAWWLNVRAAELAVKHWLLAMFGGGYG
jgi:hypothetical protein